MWYGVVCDSDNNKKFHVPVLLLLKNSRALHIVLMTKAYVKSEDVSYMVKLDLFPAYLLTGITEDSSNSQILTVLHLIMLTD